MSLPNVEDAFPLTPMQSGMLHHTLAEQGSGVFVEQFCSVLEGELNVQLLQKAWHHLIERHAALRTIFLWEGLDHPLQVVRQKVDLPWQELNWQNHDESLLASQRETLLEADRRQGFDLSHAPLMRIHLIREQADLWRMVWSFYHGLLDGWSAMIVLKELFATYASLCDNQSLEDCPPRYSFREFVNWQTEQDHQDAKKHWRQKLQGFQHPSIIRVLDAERSQNQSHGHARRESVVDQKLADQLSAFARDNRVTLSTLINGAWSILLSRYVGNPDVVYGVTIAGRPPELPGVENSVGLFLNTLPLRASVTGNQHLGDWLGQLQSQLLELSRFSFSSLADVQRQSDLPDSQPLLDSIVVVENITSDIVCPSRNHAVNVTELSVIDHSNYPLALLVIPGDELMLRLVYDTALFGQDSIDRMLDHLKVLLAEFVKSSEATLSELSMLTDSEKDLLLVNQDDSHNASQLASVIELFDQQVGRQPEATAIRFEDTSLTYKQLNERSDTLASMLRRENVKAGTLVGLYVDRSPEMLIGILAVLKAGGAYVPLDPNYPDQHRQFVINDAKIGTILTQQSYLYTLLDCDARIIAIDDVQEAPKEPVLSRPAGNDPAYVIYTSGSTGTPKGVVVTHRNLVQSTQARTEYYDSSVENFLLLSSVAFDSSVAGLFWTLCSGGTLVLPSPGLEQDAERLVNLIADAEVTHTLCLPSLYALMIEHADASRLKSLKNVIVAGEVCSTAVPEMHFKKLPTVRFYNEYGPTEATVWSTVYHVGQRDSSNPIPIGRAIPGATCLVLDHHKQPVGIGVPGELYVGGEGVTQGYLDREELTCQKYVKHPLRPGQDARLYRTGDLVCYRADGNLIFLGRNDRQIKLRGYRIELDEIQSRLQMHPSVQDAIVVATDRGNVTEPETTAPASPASLNDVAESGLPTRQPHANNTPSRLIAYVELRNQNSVGTELTLIKIREAIREQLPKHMNPDVILPLDAIPRLPNGKVDVNKIPSPDQKPVDSELSFEAPRDDVEQTLAKIWSELLSMELISIHDNFFDLGGDSIIGIQLISRARSADIQIDPHDLVDRPTIAQLAAKTKEKTLLSNSGHDCKMFLPGATGDYLLHCDLDSVLSNQSKVNIRLTTLDVQYTPETTFEEMAARYVEEVQRLQPTGPYYFWSRGCSAVMAFEVCQQLLAAGEKVEFLGIVDWPPSLLAKSVWHRYLRHALSLLRRGDLRRLVSRTMQAVRWRLRPQRNISSQDYRPADKLRYTEIRSNYVSKKFPGAITYFVSEAYAKQVDGQDSIRGWRELAQGEFECVTLPGGRHPDVFQPPHRELFIKQLDPVHTTSES